MTAPIKSKERDGVVQALRAGVVPKLGLRHIQVGRSREIEEIVKDVERVATGGSAVRFVIGEYGSGKTFFLNLTRAIAMEKKLVVAHADLAPDRRLHATGGQARNLYSELMRNVATRTKPDGGALNSIVERFIMDARSQTSGTKPEEIIQQRLAPLQDLVAGYDFARVVERYWVASEEGDEHKKAAAMRWLRAEYTTKTEAREDLGVRSIIDDASVYDYLKLLSRFVRLAGYDGLLVVVDEMVNLFKLVSAQARNANYEQILRIVNDVLQGSAENIGFMFGGTPEFLLDSRRGLYSYEALRSRLAENTFAKDGIVDLSGPVIRLKSLSQEELLVLLRNLRHLFASGDPARYLVPDEALDSFLEHCSKKIGDAYFRTPRNTIKAFLDLLAVLEQNPDSEWSAFLGKVEVGTDVAPPNEDIDDDAPTGTPGQRATVGTGKDDDLASFKI